MKRLSITVILLSIFMGMSWRVSAQTEAFELLYNEPIQGTFAGNNQTEDGILFERRFLFDIQENDIPVIRVTRISGQFSPRVHLYNANNELVASGQDTGFPDTDLLIYEEGLSLDQSPYQVEVLATDIIANTSDNPIEYSLVVEQDGRIRADADENLAPLPSIGLTAPPDFLVGDPATPATLNLPFYGQTASVESSPTSDFPSRVLATTDDWELTINQGSNFVTGIQSVSFLNEGIGLTIRNATLSQFFSDENVRVGYSELNDVYTFAFPDREAIIVTDFEQVESLIVQDGIAVFRVMAGDTIKRIVLDDPAIDFQQLTSGENEARLHQIALSNDSGITTDFLVYETLAFYQSQVRVYYPNNARFISELSQLSLRENASDDSAHAVSIAVSDDERITFQVGWARLNDVYITPDQLFVEARNGVSLVEPLSTVQSVLFTDGASQITRRDQSLRTLLPDGTDIETPIALPQNSDVLPSEAGYRTRNFNNLGEDIVTLCTCIGDLQDHTPVNPANGNFFYSVDDFIVLGRGLQPSLTRYYNSHDTGISPAYFATSPTPYAQFGTGWRHSYQYELDISGAPKDRVRFIEPDGTSHYFTPADSNGTRWQSRTLLSVVLTRASQLGEWSAQRTDGLRFYFDRAGRLTRISETPERSLILTPLPRISNAPSEDGMLVVGPYGRRLEFYVGQNGRIQTVQDTLLRIVTYGYDDNNLISVQNVLSRIANYAYDSANRLSSYDDLRSDYLQTGTLAYDDRGRVITFIRNPDGINVQENRYAYDDTDREASRVFTVSGERRVTTWQYNDLWQLVNLSLPRVGWDYAFEYDATTGTLASVRTPLQVRFNLTFDARGNLTRFEDPVYTGDDAYTFTYDTRSSDDLSLLTQINYPNGLIENFTWQRQPFPQLLSHTVTASTGFDGRSRTTQYQYDAFGRLVLQIQPNNIGTLYQYDETGYVSTIWQGIQVADEEAYTDITEAERAFSVASFNYNLYGQLVSATDGRGTRYTISPDPVTRQINAITITGADGSRLDYSYNYDERGNIISVSEPASDGSQQTTAYTYNGLDLVSTVSNPLGGNRNYAYDEAGNVTSIVDERERTTTFVYDALDNLVSYRSAAGFITRYTTELDPDGDFIIRTETDPIGRIIETRYDSLDRLRLHRLTVDDTTLEYSFSYTSTGNLASVIETGSGRTLRLEYNLLGDPLAIDIEGSRTSFAYNARGLLQSVTSPADKVTSYDYDVLGNLAQVTYPDELAWAYTYDPSSNLVSATDPLGNETQYVYSGFNQLRSEIDPLGNRTEYAYDPRGNLLTIINAIDVVQEYNYDPLDRIVESTVRGIAGEEARTTTYEYDASGRLTNIVFPNRIDRALIAYDAEDNIIAYTQRNQRTLYSYDALGNITSITDPAGQTTVYEYDGYGNVISITDPIGNVQSYSWSASTGFLTAFTDFAGRDYEYNTDTLGRLTLLRYVRLDAGAEETTLFDAINTQLTYDADGYITRIERGTDASRTNNVNIRATEYVYDDNGNVVAYIDPTGARYNLQYNDAGQIVQSTDPIGIATTYTYDAVGNVVRIVRYVDTPDEVTERFEYDASGNLVTYISATEATTTYTYNELGEINTITLAAGTDDAQTYTFGYNTSGQLESITYPDGSETVYRYVLGNVTRITRNAPETEESLETRYTYDGAGNLDAILLPGADEDINVTYDALDRRVRYVNGADDSWAYTYDAASNLAQISDPLGSVVTYIYDDYDRVTQIAYPSGSVVDLNYDTRGNLRTVVLPVNSAGTAQIITYRLNANQQIEEMQIGNNVTAFSYDGMGNVIQRVSPDGTTTDYQYDSANRLVAMLYDNQAPVLFSYDADGNLVRANDITFAYDVLGRRIQSTANLAIAYTYDNSNNLLTRTTDTLGTTTYSYDAFNRVTSVALDDVSATISYDSEGQIASIQRSNNVRTNFTYDEVGRPFTIGHSSDAVARLDTLSYFYDPAGNVTRVNRLNNDGSSQISYSYDVDQRLISERWLNDEGETIYTISYAYDNAGNRISENRNGRITNYTYDNQNRLTAETRNASGQGRQFILVPIFGLGLGALIVRRRRKWWLVIPVATLFVGSVFAQTNADEIRVSYEYNVFSSVETVTYRSDDDVDVLAYAYDAENRLVNVSGTNREGDAVNTTITYDPFSRIVSISTLDADYTLYWDNHTLIGMDDGSGVDRFLWLNDTQLATLTAEGETLWHLNDRQGTTRRFVDSTGALVDDPANFLEFGSFGVRIYPYSEDRVAPNGATITVPTLFANGQLYEPSIDMYLLGVRAYDPTIGRFIQLDPVRQDPFGTLYTYTRNRPLVFADPTGMVVETFNAPVSSATAPDAIAPSDLLPAFDMPIDTMPSVHRQQANEVFRMLELLMATRYGVNGSVLQLSSFNDALYLQNLNPVPESVQMASAEPLMNLMAYYSQDDGWQTDPRPSSNDAYDAFAFLRDMEGMLAQAYVRPAIFCCDTPMAQDFAFVPQVTLPQGRSADSLQTSMFVDLLQPISTLPSLEPDVENLDSLLPLAIAPVVSLPEVNLPSAPVEPQILDSLDALRQQTFEFNSRIWSLDGQDCDACLPPLGFSQ